MALFDSGDEGDPEEDGDSQTNPGTEPDDSTSDTETGSFDPEALFNSDGDGDHSQEAESDATPPTDPAPAEQGAPDTADPETSPSDDEDPSDTPVDADDAPEIDDADVQDALRSAFSSGGNGDQSVDPAELAPDTTDTPPADSTDPIAEELDNTVFAESNDQDGEQPEADSDQDAPSDPESIAETDTEEPASASAEAQGAPATDTPTNSPEPKELPDEEAPMDPPGTEEDDQAAATLIPQDSDSDSPSPDQEITTRDDEHQSSHQERRERFSQQDDESDDDTESSPSFLEKIGLGRFLRSATGSATHHGSVFERDDSGELYVPEDILTDALDTAIEDAAILDQTIDNRTVDVNEEFDEDEFFSTPQGDTTVVNRYDLEKAVPIEKKLHFEERERYWVNKPYSFITIFHSRKENETKYYVVEPHLTPIESELRNFLTEKLRTAIKYESEEALADKTGERASVIERETRRLLKRYDLYTPPDEGIRASLLNPRSWFANGNGADSPDESSSFSDTLTAPARWIGLGDASNDDTDDESDADVVDKSDTFGDLDGLSTRPEPILIEEDADTISQYQVEKLLYMLKRDFVGYERIDAIKHDINVEDISCDGYNSPVFVYHTDYENIITNVYHGETELDEFVVKLAQRSGKGISKRQPQVDATLPDGSRSQLTLGREVSDHGTNYTIRQFKDVPFTPIDLINWRTFSLDQMGFLWLAIENHKSLIFAGGTASGKTTSLNAVSLFIPSNSKIVSIEDTREVELPQRNWIASVTRPSFSDDEQGDIDEFDLLEAALRQRPDYIVMGEVRGEEGRTLFQVMSTGHTTYTTFHADSVGEVLKRFTTEPINVSKTLFTALDLVSVQTQTRVQGNKVRKSKSITEINEYNAENDEINVQDVYQWRAETDNFEEVGRSNVLDQIMFDRGWSHDDLSDELFKRRVVLAYLIRNGLNDYAQVAATVQAFISDPDTVLALIANDALEERLEDLREMESVQINIEPEKEALVPRPDPGSAVYELTGELLDEAETRLFDKYDDTTPTTQHLEQALATTSDQAPDVPPVEGAE